MKLRPGATLHGFLFFASHAVVRIYFDLVSGVQTAILIKCFE